MLSSVRFALSVLLVLLLSMSPAYAYIDPNAGGLLFQLLAPLFAAVLGGWLFLRRWISDLARRLWRRVLGRPEE
ncbi:hypothetical protein ABT392_11100 [Paucibacter sp. JuS9]|uniref:hypothetical protein n=1 Tax=Roseateles TaxID=93681 RepID=UPI002FE60CE6